VDWNDTSSPTPLELSPKCDTSGAAYSDRRQANIALSTVYSACKDFDYAAYIDI